MTRRHYESTVVPESKSLLDIEYLLRLHKVDAVRWTTSAALIRIEFAWPYHGTNLSFRMDLAIHTQDVDGMRMTVREIEQERRRQLRVLLNHIKAKLVAVEEGLVDLEQEFLPYMLGPGGRTVGAVAKEELQAALRDGRMPDVKALVEG